MKTIKPLGLRPLSPLENESLVGFLRRIARRNGFSHISELYAFLGQPFGRPMMEDLPSLAAQLSVDISALEAMTPRSGADAPVLEWRFQRNHVDPFCPSCLEEGLPWHASWRHCLVTTCVRHGVALEDSCPRCLMTITPKVGGLRKCDCGFDLTRTPPQGASAFAAWVSALIAGEGGCLRDAPHYGPWSDEAPDSLAAFLVFLAGSAEETRSDKPSKMPLPRGLSDTHRVLESVEPWFRDWPVGFTSGVLARLEAGDMRANSAPGRLGKWYQRLMRFRGPGYEAIRTALEAVIAEHFDGTYAGPIEGRQWISATEAARFLSVRVERVVAAVADGKLEGRQASSGLGHQHTTVPRRAVDEVIGAAASYMTGIEVRAYLGIGKAQQRLLEESGLLAKTPKGELPALVDSAYRKEAVDAMLAPVLASAMHIPIDQSAADTRAFRDLTLRRTTDKAALQSLFATILSGELPAYFEGQDMRLGDLLFPAGEIDKRLQRAHGRPMWTANEVAAMTGWKAEVVTHWCRQGVLEAVQVPHGAGVKYLVDPRALSVFQRTYVPLAELAKDAGTSSRALRKSLSSRRISIRHEMSVGKTTRGALVRLAELVGDLS